MRSRWNRCGPLGLVLGLCAVSSLLPEPATAAGSSHPGLDQISVSEDLAASLWESRAAPSGAVPAYCPGGYRIIDFPQPRSSDPDAFPIEALGERGFYDMDGRVEMFGDVRIVQGNRAVRAAQAQFDDQTGDGSAEGGVLLLEPGTVLQGQRGLVDFGSGAAELEDVQFVLLDNAFRGRARTLAQDGAGDLTMLDGGLTRCEPGHGGWWISASRLHVEEDAVFGSARNAVMRVGPVPVFYTPYIRFPVSDARQSGWLFPNIEFSDEDGLDFSMPYYLNLAPNYDATLTPRYVEERGPALEGQFRHLSRGQETTMTAAILHDDDQFDGTFERDDFEELRERGEVAGEFETEDRWLYAMNHDGAFGPWRTFVDYAAVSDRDYFRDLGSDIGVSSRIELERVGGFEYASGGLLARVWAQRFQRLDEIRVDPIQRLPQIDLSYSRAVLGPLEASVSAQFTTFTRDNDELSGLTAAVGDRTHLEQRLTLPLTAPWGFLTLSGGVRHTQYALRDMPEGLDATPDRTLTLGSAHGGLVFERDLEVFGTGVIQTLEPELFYLYQGFEDQSELPRFDATRLDFGFEQLFRDNRFAGLDRIGDANQLSVGVTTRFVDPASGREYLRASLGEIVFFEDREVTLAGPPSEDDRDGNSDLAGELQGTLSRHWRLGGDVVWDHEQARAEEAGARLQYRRDNRHVVNLGYRRRIESDIDQSDFSLYWAVSRRWAVMGRWNFDFAEDRTIEGFGGIEYNDCCWRIRVMARRFLDSPTAGDLDDVDVDEGIFLQIVFKGLAGFGSKIDSVLQRGIPGFRSEAVTDVGAF